MGDSAQLEPSSKAGAQIRTVDGVVGTVGGVVGTVGGVVGTVDDIIGTVGESYQA
ncbi:hypothetical protein [Williamsia soli]|uniref:hypothetical protein n=1 Tax=Williamsia soli TaxID=364929 RepID=UPI001A9DAA0D|nr:hypothetical protein [Williamsia soli]